MTQLVMRGLDPRIHDGRIHLRLGLLFASSWIAGSSPAMTKKHSRRRENHRWIIRLSIFS
jgi:hypothetical protein